METIKQKSTMEMKEQKDEVLALPPDLDKTKTRKDKFGKFQFFSPAVFKESLKSNWISWIVVGLGNALILIIIVMILSTLNINATKTALSDLFNNADMESTIKTGAVGLYSAFDQSAQNYETMNKADDQAVKLSETMYIQINDKDNLAMMDTMSKTYDAIYTSPLLGANDSEKTKDIIVTFSDYALTGNTSLTEAQKKALELLNIKVPDVSNLDEEQKSAIKTAIPYYCDEYYKEAYNNGSRNDKTINSRELIVNIVPSVAKDILMTKMGASEDNATQASTLVQKQIVAFNKAYDANSSMSAEEEEKLAKKMANESAFELIPLLSDDSMKDQVTTVINALKQAYNKKDNSGVNYQEKFINNTDGYKSKAMSDAIQKAVVDAFRNIAYYNYLPTFEVDYVTDDLGYPIEYVQSGEFDEKGEPILKPIRITKYNPSKYIKVNSDMGAQATMVQKMHKDLLTGEDYSKDEIQKAKEDANKEIDGQIIPYLSSFMNDFLTRDENNTNAYFDGVKVDEIAISDRVTGIVSETAEKQLVDTYNEKYGTSIKSASEIISKNGSMDGKTMMDTVYSYSSGGISSFRILYSNNLNNGYTTQDAMLSAMVRSTLGVINQLPSKVNDSLTEMGELNTYGIFVGVVAFGMASVLIPMVYTIITANSLVADKVETGSLAFTLSTPIKRSTFISTEAIFMITTETVLGGILFLGALAARGVGIAMGGTDLVESLSISNMVQYALGNYMVTLAISGICFCASSVFNKTRHAISIGGGLNIFFFICSILGLFGTQAIPGTVRIDAMNVFNYFSILSLYDGMAVMNGDVIYWYKLIGLLAISIATYASGIAVFNKKDLPL